MNEMKAIDSAYQSAVENLFKIFSTSLIATDGDAAAEKKAEETFKKALVFNQKVYNRAKAIVEAQDKS